MEKGWRAAEVSSRPEPGVDPMVANEGRGGGRCQGRQPPEAGAVGPP